MSPLGISGFGADTTLDGEFVEQKTNETFDFQLDRYLNDSYFMWSNDQRQFALRFQRWKETAGRWVPCRICVIKYRSVTVRMALDGSHTLIEHAALGTPQ